MANNNIYYEIRWEYNDNQFNTELNKESFPSLKQAWDFYKSFIQPSINFYKKHKLEHEFNYLGCFRIHQLEKIDFDNYKDTITYEI